MNKLRKFMAVTLGVLLLGVVSGVMAMAQCGGASPKAVALSYRAHSRAGSLMLARWSPGEDDRDEASTEPIVGMWKVSFVATGPDGGQIEVDHGYSVWHSDHTEILNSARPPTRQNFCLGVWKKVGGRSYRLNHFALDFADGVHQSGIVQITEEVTVEWSGKTFEGKFTIAPFDLNGVAIPGAAVTGIITGRRVTVNTTPSD